MHVDQNLDVIEKKRGHFRIHRPKVSQKQVSDLSQEKLCSPVLSIVYFGLSTQVNDHKSETLRV